MVQKENKYTFEILKSVVKINTVRPIYYLAEDINDGPREVRESYREKISIVDLYNLLTDMEISSIHEPTDNNENYCTIYFNYESETVCVPKELIDLNATYNNQEYSIIFYIDYGF